MPPDRPTVAEINLDHLSHNLEQVRLRVGSSAEILAVVKANAYGHGAVSVARRLVSDGVAMLGVATVEEGIELREAEIEAPILILGGIFGEDLTAAAAFHFRPVVYSREILRSLSKAALAAGTDIDVHVKVDTGMGRLGTALDDLPDLIAAIAQAPGLRVEGILTHFAEADLADAEFARLQLALFERAVRMLREEGMAPRYVHAANSAAILTLPESHQTLVRPGIALYGYLPSPALSFPTPLKPVMSFKTKIVHVKTVTAGTPISYGRTFVTKRTSRIGTLPAGYADGFDRRLSNRGEVLVAGRRAPVVGRVCMDLAMIDLTDIPDSRAGDEAVLIGGQTGPDGTAGFIGADEMASWMETIPYDVLCGIGPRVPRRIAGGTRRADVRAGYAGAAVE
jgi:alanine racemase